MNINYQQVPDKTSENKFICEPVSNFTLEVKQKEQSSFYGVEWVEILDQIAFDDDDVEDTF